MLKRIIGVGIVTAVLAFSLVAPALAAPSDSASHVALCATSMGGQHVAQ